MLATETPPEDAEQIYDGREFLGSVRRLPRSAGCEAYGPDDRFLRAFECRGDAVAALREARRWRAVQVGAAGR